MKHRSSFQQLLAAQQEIIRLQGELRILKGFTIQQCLDLAQITLHTEFGFGPERCKAFQRAFLSVLSEIVQLFLEDDRDDPELVYAKEKLDRALRAACGEETAPFDERYAEERLFFWDKLEATGGEGNAP